MQIPWQGIQGFSGATAIGSIVLVDLILLANAFAANLLPTIEIYADTPTWAIVAAIPLVALAYLVGLLAVGGGEILLIGFHIVNSAMLIEDAIIVSAKHDSIVGRYVILRQEAEMLAGSSLAFGLLSLSSAVLAWQILGWWRLLTAVALTSLIMAVFSTLLSRSRHRAAHDLAVLSDRKRV